MQERTSPVPNTITGWVIGNETVIGTLLLRPRFLTNPLQKIAKLPVGLVEYSHKIVYYFS